MDQTSLPFNAAKRATPAIKDNRQENNIKDKYVVVTNAILAERRSFVKSLNDGSNFLDIFPNSFADIFM